MLRYFVKSILNLETFCVKIFVDKILITQERTNIAEIITAC